MQYQYIFKIYWC